MGKSMQVIISEIDSYIQNGGGIFQDWYVGIASNPRERLFIGHKVVENGDAWIYQEAMNSNEARAVEKFFLDKLVTGGGSGGGDYTSIFMYAYKKTSHSYDH